MANIINDIENSAYIQALKQEFAEAQAAGATQEQLLNIHQKAQDYRQSYGYTANLDGSKYTVIESYEPALAAKTQSVVNTGLNALTGTGGADLSIDTSNLGNYIKYAAVGVIFISVLDTIFGGRK